MVQPCVCLLLALLITAIAAESPPSPAADDLVANVGSKQDNYAASVASHNTENQPEHDISGLTSAMKSQQDAGIAAAENVASHEEHDISGLTSAMKSQQDAGIAAAENILADESHDSSGVSVAGRRTSSCAHSSIDNTVRTPIAQRKRQ